MNIIAVCLSFLLRFKWHWLFLRVVAQSNKTQDLWSRT